jgi:hypothetical protein
VPSSETKKKKISSPHWITRHCQHQETPYKCNHCIECTCAQALQSLIKPPVHKHAMMARAPQITPYAANVHTNTIIHVAHMLLYKNTPTFSATTPLTTTTTATGGTCATLANRPTPWSLDHLPPPHEADHHKLSVCAHSDAQERLTE